MADDLFVGIIAVEVVVVIRCIRAVLERFDMCHRGLAVSFRSHSVASDNAVRNTGNIRIQSWRISTVINTVPLFPSVIRQLPRNSPQTSPPMHGDSDMALMHMQPTQNSSTLGGVVPI